MLRGMKLLIPDPEREALINKRNAITRARATKEKRIVHGQEIWVTVYPARWADGATRQLHGRKKNKSRN